MVIDIDLTLLNPNMATKMLYYPPLLREKRLNSKTTFLIKEDKYNFKIAICSSKSENCIYVQ